MTVPYHAAHGPTLTVAIADDAELVSGGLRTILSGHPTLRLVTHLDVDDDGIARTLAAFAGFFGRH